MSPSQLAALVIFGEARGEPRDGKAAVMQVVLNRQARGYESDGTLAGTILRPNQFSEFYFDFVNGKYTRVCWTQDQAAARAEKMLVTAMRAPEWATCALVAGDMLDGSYAPDTSVFHLLKPDAVLYANLGIVATPPWALPGNLLCRIGAHSFFKDPA